MVKFIIVFRQPKDLVKFEDGYNNFLALIERMPHVQRRQVVNVLGSPVGTAAFYRILEVYYDDYPTLQQSLRSQAGQEAGAELAKFTGKDSDMIFAEVYEEAGGSTPTDQSSPTA